MGPLGVLASQRAHFDYAYQCASIGRWRQGSDIFAEGIMTKALLTAALPLALLCGCGTPMVWQGPSGTGQQELSDAKRECLTHAEAWRSHNELVYQQSVEPAEAIGNQRASADLYRTENQLFDQCMVAQGYKLVPREQ
jgi:hypothetical protein